MCETDTDPHRPGIAPGVAPTRLRLQQRTERSYVLPPGLLEALVGWFSDRAFAIRAARSEAEYCRLAHGTLADGRTAELAILYRSGAVLVQGADWRRTTARLACLVDPTPGAEQVCLFDDDVEVSP